MGIDPVTFFNKPDISGSFLSIINGNIEKISVDNNTTNKMFAEKRYLNIMIQNIKGILNTKKLNAILAGTLIDIPANPRRY